MHRQVSYRTHGFTFDRDLVWRSFTQICKLKGIVNVLQVQMFLYCLCIKPIFVRERPHRSRFHRFIDELLMLFDKPAKFCKIVYSRIFSHQVGRGSLEMLSITRRAYIEALSYATRGQRLSRRRTEEREHVRLADFHDRSLSRGKSSPDAL